MRTSISDYENYKKICFEASINDEVFNIFRNHPDYTEILEHVSYQTGLQYLNHILFTNKLELNQKHISIIKKVDHWGNPQRSEYEQIGNISPTMLRYFSIISDIDRLYGSLNDKTIVEIGAGYGGQSMMINLMYNIKEYIIVDLPEVLNLINKFLQKNNMDMTKYKFYTLNNLPNIYSDFVISNYAFSECYKEIQDVYISKILNNSKNFYMILNFMSDTLIYNKEELLEKLQGNIKIYPEIPSTSETNLLFYKE